MHTLMIIGFGFALLAGLIAVGRLFGAGPWAGARWFIPAWFLASIANMWVGVSHAGYTVAQEMPITLVVFGVPAVAAWFIGRRGT